MSFKKIFAGLISLAAAVVCAISVSAAAQTSGDYRYSVLDNGTVEITDYNGADAKLTLPSTLGGRKVTSIGAHAFMSCKSLTSVTIPKGVTDIGDMAFWSCSSLASITLPDGVKSIGGYAFSGCKISSIKIPDSVTSIGFHAFASTPLLNNQTTTVKYAGKWAIDCNESAKTATIKSGTVGIADRAFWCCSSLVSINIPSSVKRIGNSAFFACDSLKEVWYVGSKAVWAAVGTDNDDLTSADGNINISGLKVKGRAGDALRIAWDKNASADGYIIEMKVNGTWTRIGKVTKNSTVEFRKSGLKAGTAYNFRVKAYKMDGKTALYSGYTSISARTNPSVVTGLKIKGRAGDALRLAWAKNTSADGYIIEMKSGSKWVRVGKITKNSTVEFRKDKLKAGTAYTFRVKAYKMSGKTALYGATKTISVRTNPSTVSGLKLKASAKNAVRLSWTKNTSADGYIIEMKVNGIWKRAGKITKNTTVEFKKSGLKSKTSYTFRIKAYKMSGKTALYSGYKTITVKTK